VNGKKSQLPRRRATYGENGVMQGSALSGLMGSTRQHESAKYNSNSIISVSYQSSSHTLSIMAIASYIAFVQRRCHPNLRHHASSLTCTQVYASQLWLGPVVTHIMNFQSQLRHAVECSSGQYHVPAVPPGARGKGFCGAVAGPGDSGPEPSVTMRRRWC
jgi:hypothetical protein